MNPSTSPKHKNETNLPPCKVVCVGTVVLRDENVLFVRQAQGQSLEGQWSIPWGFVETDESPEDAALRETLEEAGITAEVRGLIGFQNLNHPGWIGMVFLCGHISGEPAADGVETDQARYLGKQDLALVENPIEPWCRWLVQRVLAGQISLIEGDTDHPYSPRRAYI